MDNKTNGEFQFKKFLNFLYQSRKFWILSRTYLFTNLDESILAYYVLWKKEISLKDKYTPFLFQ